MRFHMTSKMLARPSSVAFEMDLRGLQDVHRLGDSVLGQVMIGQHYCFQFIMLSNVFQP